MNTTRAENPARISLCLLVGTAPFFVNGLYNPHLASTPILFWLAELTTWVAIPLFIYLYGVRNQLFNRTTLGLDGRIFGRYMPWAIVFASIILAVFWQPLDKYVYDFAARYIKPTRTYADFSYKDMVPPPGPSTGLLRLLALLYLSASAGIVEEFYYRALVLRITGTGLIATPAFILISTILFTATHWEQGAFGCVGTAVFGLIAANLYLLLRNLWPIIFAHAVIDFQWFS